MTSVPEVLVNLSLNQFLQVATDIKAIPSCGSKLMKPGRAQGAPPFGTLKIYNS